MQHSLIQVWGLQAWSNRTCFGSSLRCCKALLLCTGMRWVPSLCAGGNIIFFFFFFVFQTALSAFFQETNIPYSHHHQMVGVFPPLQHLPEAQHQLASASGCY